MAEVANDVEPSSSCAEEREMGLDETKISNDDDNNTKITAMSRKEKRKALKKMKRKQLRREKALKEKEEEEARLNDPEEHMRLLRLEQEEAERMERDRREFEERERKFLEELELKKNREEEEEEEQRRKLREESGTKSGDKEKANELDEVDDWEYIEEGPAEIIWKGNEIIVKKKKVRVKKSNDSQNIKQESDRPISNPLAPQSEAFEDYRSAQEVLASVAQQVPNFGTEQDKAHCPFHLKTGVCRFGARCSRVHFYPDKSCTLLMKNMYSGPGLAWEQDDGLEYTDDEVERSFEDFYEDVHTEFLKFGELVNFKVCKNSSSHLRGNVYVHYKSLESAVLAYQSINGRYFAGKQISCEFVNVTKWKVAICGEFMKSRLKTCSRGSTCNFIHCFRNPAGDYEWADWDKPPPRFWLKKMAALFGYTPDRPAEFSPRYAQRRSRSRGPGRTHRKSHSDEDDDWRRHHHRRHKDDRRSRSRAADTAHGHSNEDDDWRRDRHRRHREYSRERISDPVEMHDEKMSSHRYHNKKHRKSDAADISDDNREEEKSFVRRKRSRQMERDSELTRENKIKMHEPEYETESVKKGEDNRYLDHRSRSSKKQTRVGELDHHYRDKADEFDRRENSDADRHHDEYDGCKSKPSVHETEETDSSDADSPEGRHKREKHRHRNRDKRSSRHRKHEAQFSDSASDRDIGRDEIRHQKNVRRNSRSKDESDSIDIANSKGRCSRDESHHERGRRNSRHHREDSVLSNVDCAYKNHEDGDDPEEKDDRSHIYGNDDKYSSSVVASSAACEAEEDNNTYGVEHRPLINESSKETAASQKVEAGGRQFSCPHMCGEPESELELAYRLAALTRLEEMKKSKDSQPGCNSENIESASKGQDSHSKVVQGEAVSNGSKELTDSNKLEIRSASMKRRRI